ncbi:MAG: hypothetical protein Q8Q49_03015, partial [bacterium]|nr:hypothetical protein [bacterium]
KNGIIVPPRADAFVRTIQTLSDSRLRKHIGQKARQYTLQYFSWEKTVNEYLRIFQKVDYNNTRPR